MSSALNTFCLLDEFIIVKYLTIYFFEEYVVIFRMSIKAEIRNRSPSIPIIIGLELTYKNPQKSDLSGLVHLDFKCFFFGFKSLWASGNLKIQNLYFICLIIKLINFLKY